jgi:calcineurin-like phosphoesterase family protein
MIYFTSDEHFDHSNIIKFCNRPFSDRFQMRDKLIENHNSVVTQDDTVFHCGDMFWKTIKEKEANEILAQLHGKHVYIRGNHEEVIDRYASVRFWFSGIYETYNLKVEGYPNIWLSHYAHRVWNGSHRGSYHLYGHTHAVLPEDGTLSFDTGVDAQNFYPISLTEVHERLQLKLDKFKGMDYVCTNEKCQNRFDAVDLNPKVCAKCLSQMLLVRKGTNIYEQSSISGTNQPVQP